MLLVKGPLMIILKSGPALRCDFQLINKTQVWQIINYLKLTNRTGMVTLQVNY